ncbi:MAG: asparagine synthase (glutamine-hydrolyzing) [Steroidobacteraceae bacterium]
MRFVWELPELTRHESSGHGYLMCGIVGFQGNFDRELLQSMMDSVAHRGPDGEGHSMCRFESGPVTGLGHRRLAIVDLSNAACQPMTLPPDANVARQSGLTLIHNGEIFNFKELKRELSAAGHQFTSDSDSEVLLHLYVRDGVRMVEKLNGMFAFAIHDCRPTGRSEGIERGDLFLARDQLGVKPLYFAETPKGFLFGSEMKALLCEPGITRDIDPAALHYLLAYLWTPAPLTVLTGVKKLEPGAAMLVRGGRAHRRWSYYTIPYEGRRLQESPARLAEKLAEHVYTAVKRQLMADVPVGAFLSGGLDSSAVVAMMRRAMPDKPIHCFSINFGGGIEEDGNPADLPYARKVAATLGVTLHEVLVEPSALTHVEEMVRWLDEPQADLGPINTLRIAEQARKLGIPVLLSGTGGDDLFGGYRRHWALSFERSWGWLPHPIRRAMQGVASAAASGHARGQSTVVLRRLAKMFSHAAETPDRRIASYFLWSTEAVRRGLYTPEFAARTAHLDTLEPLMHSLKLIPDEPDRLQRMLFLEARHFLADDNLSYSDHAGMAAGIEIRVPLLDVDLVHFATGVRSGLKQDGRLGKALFKRAMEPYLPHNVIYRPKSGFGGPLRRWLKHDLQDLLANTLDDASLRRRGIFDPAAVRRLIEQNRSGAIDGSYTIFAMMCFELWCRSHLDH